jgi:subtilisin family serine protease
MIQSLLVALCALFFSSTLIAATLEPEVARFLQGENNQRAEIRVIVSFENQQRTTQPLSQKTLMDFSEERSQKLMGHLGISRQQLDSLWIANSFVLSVNPTQLKKLLELSPQSVWLANKRERIFPMKWATPEFRAPSRFTYGLEKLGVPELWKNNPEWNGKGVRVAVLDTGIDDTHPDLADRLTLFANFSPAKSNKPSDEFNHGTHVAGTAVGEFTNDLGIGVAPGADLLVGRIFDGRGESTREQILESLQWTADPDGDPDTQDRADVVNGSWSSDNIYTERELDDHVFCYAVNNMRAMGIIPVFSAGNDGPEIGSVRLPGGCSGAFSVGATDPSDRLMRFSGVGPAIWKNAEIQKPEVVAPGFEILSASAGWTTYTEMSGTSMATPHVTGAFAILKQVHPEASVEKLMEAMKRGAKDLGPEGHDKDFGWGRVDINESLRWLEQQQ